jgi:site-specific DNA recombinase
MRLFAQEDTRSAHHPHVSTSSPVICSSAHPLAKKKMVRNNREMEKITYFIYARKSSRSDDRQKLSIPAQLKALKKLAHDQGLAIASVITERESAHAAGRPQFGEMIRRIEAGEACGIIAWHPDRVARNSTDGGRIIDLLDARKLKDLKFCTFWFENTPQGKANLGHAFVESKQFSDKLSCDTQRGQREKAEMGYYPSKAPIGYLNNVMTKTVVVDRELAPVIKRVFEKYAEGGMTLWDVQIELAKGGITTKATRQWKSTGGNLVNRDVVRRLLHNPFYYGHFTYAGVLYEGKHTPIITKRVFDTVQEVLAERTHAIPPEKQPKPFTRLLRCGECRMMVTAEIHKGHTYYRCTRKASEHRCLQPFIREELLDMQISQLLSGFVPADGWGNEMLRRLTAETTDLAKAAERRLRQEDELLTHIVIKQQKLLETYLDPEGLIDRNSFALQKAKLLKEKKRVQDRIADCEQEHHAWLEPFKEWILTAQSLGKTALTGTLREKRVLAKKIFGSNLVLLSKQAHGLALEPWPLLQNKSSFPDAVHCYDLARKHFVNAC